MSASAPAGVERFERSVAGTLRSAWGLVPRGRGLPDETWRGRHRVVVLLLWAHAVGITAFGIAKGFGVTHSTFEGAIVAGAALLACWNRFGRVFQAGAASAGLLTASAVLVHLSGGYIELHFHFFVMVGLMALYQHWVPFLLAVGYVVVHHGLVGVLDPTAVYNHPAAWAHPWRWAAIHGGFITAASIVSLTAWRLNEHQALHDSLTGLGNRALFRDRLAHALARGARRDSQLAVLFLDLDNFKSANDTAGHGTGDQVLVAVAARLKAELRQEDTLARLGGDEFAIILEDTEHVSDAARVAQRLVEVTRRPIAVGGRELSIGVSVGIVLDHGHRDADELVQNADAAMYAAKERGRGRYEIFERRMHVSALRRLELEADLQRAVEADEFVVHYQPIVDVRSGRLAGMEALARWAHPKRGVIPPQEFIAVAEETGLIVPIGRRVLETACRQAARWDEREPTDGSWTLSVNLSPRQLNEPRLPDEIGEILAASGFDPSRLVLELTESAMLGETEATIARFERLKALGVELAIDDFGTGYSSLSYLRQFPIDILKIDRSVLRGVGSDARGFELARAVITL